MSFFMAFMDFLEFTPPIIKTTNFTKMLKIILLFLSFFTVLQFSLANSQNANSKIEKVTIFLNGAQIERSSTIQLKKGNNELIYTGVSNKIDINSIQAEAPKGVRIISSYADKVYQTSDVSNKKRIKQISDSLVYYSKQQREIAYKKKAYQKEQQVLSLYTQVGNKQTGMSVSELRELADFHRKKDWEIHKNLFELEEKSISIENRKRALSAEKTNLNKPAKGKWIHQLKIVAQSKNVTTAKITFKYLVGGAAWAPKYDIRVNGATDLISLEYHAEVMNQSGENWNNIPITVSTFVSSQSVEVPSISQWKVGKNYQLRNSGNNLAGPKSISREQAQKQSKVDLLEGVEYDEIEVSGIGVEFDIKDPYTVPTNGKLYDIHIADYKLDARFKYSAIPKIDKDAYLLSQIIGWEDLNLIEGKANIYLRNSYVGKTYIKPGMANDTLHVALGRDSKVFVGRTRIEEKSSKQIIGSNKKETFTFKITVKNSNPNAIDMMLSDQVPVPTDEEVSVNVSELSGGKQDEFTGQVDWEVHLEPGEQKEYLLSFEMKYPKNMTFDTRRRATSYKKMVRAKF